MLSVTTDEIQRNPLEYILRVEAGEKFSIVRDGKAIAELKPVLSSQKQPRPYGLCAGQFKVPEDFDAPLPDDILNAFEGK